MNVKLWTVWICAFIKCVFARPCATQTRTHLRTHTHIFIFIHVFVYVQFRHQFYRIVRFLLGLLLLAHILTVLYTNTRIHPFNSIQFFCSFHNSYLLARALYSMISWFSLFVRFVEIKNTYYTVSNIMHWNTQTHTELFTIFTKYEWNVNFDVSTSTTLMKKPMILEAVERAYSCSDSMFYSIVNLLIVDYFW